MSIPTEAHLTLPIDDEVALLIDGECIYCDKFGEISATQMRHPEVTIINLRDRPELVVLMRAAGLHPENGMLLKIGKNYFFGENAVAAIFHEYEKRHFIARLASLLFQTTWTARPLYGMLKLGRRFTLRLRKIPERFN